MRLFSEACKVSSLIFSLLQFSFNNGNKHFLSFIFCNLKQHYGYWSKWSTDWHSYIRKKSDVTWNLWHAYPWQIYDRHHCTNNFRSVNKKFKTGLLLVLVTYQRKMDPRNLQLCSRAKYHKLPSAYLHNSYHCHCNLEKILQQSIPCL